VIGSKVAMSSSALRISCCVFAQVNFILVPKILYFWVILGTFGQKSDKSGPLDAFECVLLRPSRIKSLPLSYELDVFVIS